MIAKAFDFVCNVCAAIMLVAMFVFLLVSLGGLACLFVYGLCTMHLGIIISFAGVTVLILGTVGLVKLDYL